MLLTLEKPRGFTKFDGLEPQRREDLKGFVVPEIRSKSFATFEKQAPGVRFSKDSKTLRARKAIRKTPTRLFSKAGLFIFCEGSKS